MENNELMNVENIDIIDADVIDDEKTGLGTGVAMLIGAGLTLAVGAGVKLVKKCINAHKAKKALREVNVDVYEEDEDVE
jgi:hypothetical protein